MNPIKFSDNEIDAIREALLFYIHNISYDSYWYKDMMTVLEKIIEGRIK